MPAIQVLEHHVAELIAAGEVIDRPASVVKELVENAVDAGATAITVEIQRGGVTFLRVTDDGCGIPADQVSTALLRHATSKVAAETDLEQIATLGFRGEALASICAVSQLEIFTRPAEALAGTHLVNHGGTPITVEEAGCAAGTTMLVRNLFYNTPARLNFLKTDAVEGAAVGAVMDNIALSHPEISIRFLKDGKEALHTPGNGKLQSAVYAVFGREFTEGLLPVEYTLDHVRVHGFVSKPSAARPNRRMQHFFVDGRFVKCRTAMAAMEQAFKNSIMVGKFPACVLHLEVSCRAVDVNVHPTKLEIRFVNERPVFDAVYHGVKTALQEKDTPIELTFRSSGQSAIPVEPPKPMGEQLHFTEAAHKTTSTVPGTHAASGATTKPAPSIWNTLLRPGAAESPKPVLHDSGRAVGSGNRAPLYGSEGIPFPTQGNSEQGNSERMTQPEHKAEQPVAVPAPKQAEGFPPWEPESEPKRRNRFVGELFQTYCLVERDAETLWIIDKHAAHERLLFEKLKAETGHSAAQVLLEPIPVTLGKEECQLVLESKALFRTVGFELEEFGEGTVLIRSAPLYLEGTDLGAAVVEMAGYLCAHQTDLSTEHLDWLYHNIACRAAIKAGTPSDPQELIALVERLEAHPEIRYCPHGRPVSIVMQKKELEKQFGRLP